MMLPQFKDYDGKCRLNGPLCKACRSPYHADWREAQTGMREFACPFDKPVIKESLTTGTDPIKHRGPAKVSVKTVASFIKEFSTGKMVSDEVTEKRRAICEKCDYIKEAKSGKYCSAPNGCGCNVEPRKMAFLTVGFADITRWEERNGKRLCPHSGRNAGVGGWPLV